MLLPCCSAGVHLQVLLLRVQVRLAPGACRCWIAAAISGTPVLAVLLLFPSPLPYSVLHMRRWSESISSSALIAVALLCRSKGKTAEALRGAPYLLPLEEISRRTAEAWDRGATEVCMQVCGV